MAYTEKNYKTKRQLKEDIKNGVQVRCYNRILGPDLSNYTGVVYLEGPHYPQPHKWHAQANLKDGIIIGVK